MFLDLRFLLEIMLRWMGRKATDTKADRFDTGTPVVNLLESLVLDRNRRISHQPPGKPRDSSRE